LIPKLPKRGHRGLLDSLSRDGDRRIYNTLTMMIFLLNQISPGNSWRTRFLHLIEAHDIPVMDMGFPQDWQSRPLWAVTW